MKAKRYLQNYQLIDGMIANKKEEKRLLYEKATRITASMDGERVNSSGNQQKMASAVERYVDIEMEIDERIKYLEEYKRDVIKNLERLPMLECDVLYKVYIGGMDMHDMEPVYNRGYSWITTVHGRGLQMLQEILDADERGDQNVC